MSAQQVLIGKTERFVKKYYVNRLIQGVLIGAALWIVFYLLVNTLEYFSWFSSKVRLALFIVLIIGSLLVATVYFAIPLVNLIRYRKKMSLEQAALLIGKFFPDISDKLLNTLQLSDGLSADASNELLAATIEQRTAQLNPVRFTDAIDLKGNLRYLYIFLALLCVLLALMLFLPRFAVQPAQRIINFEQEFEKPLPYSVRLSQEAIEVNQGADVAFSIQVEGSHIPDAFYVKSSRGQQVFNKVSVNEYSYVFKNVVHDLSFQVIGGEYISKPISITVHPNPALLSYQCKVKYPAYVRRTNEVFEGKTRLLVPQGSQLEFEFSVRDCDSVFIVKDSVINTLDIHSDVATFSLVAASSTSFDFSCRNAWSQHFDPIRFSVDVLPDAFPDIRVESYDEELSSKVYYSGLLTDDYGFTKLVFHCDIKQPTEREVVLPVAFDRTSPRTSFFYHFDMDSLGVLPGQHLEVYFEVWDNDGFHGPKSKRSETFSYYKPSLAALDSIVDQTENDIMERMANRSEEASKLKEDIERMLQELTSKKELDWTDKEKIKDLLEKQTQMEEEWNRLQEEQEKLSDFIKEHDLANEELMKKQEKINQLFDEVLPDELKKMMEEMEKLLDQMPRDRMQQMLQNMKQNNAKMQDLLDRNLSLLEQLKVEKDFNELMDQLDKLGEELQNQDNELSAEDAKQQFEEMMQRFDSIQERNESLTDPFNMQKDESQEESIEQDLEEASEMENSESGNQQQGSKQKKQSAGKKMQEMSNSMMMQMQMSGAEQLAEDAHLVRILLENVVRSSHQQESLMDEVGHMRTDDPSISAKIVRQKELSDNFVMVEDSLRAMALRQPAVQNFVFDEIASIDRQTELALKYINELRFSMAVNYQQQALKSMNNLALMLAESLQEMESSMMASGSCSSKSKPQKGQQGQTMQQMLQLQEQLGQQLKKMREQMQQQQGQSSSQMSEELARMAAEQEMIRQGMQQMLDEMKSNGQLGDDGLKEIMQDMERLEEEIVNKKITNQTLERNRQIMSRMLESEKAQQKRDQDEKRKSNEYKGTKFDRQVDEIFYQQQLKKNQDFLRLNPIQYQPYYKSKINEYYLKKNSK
jgi:hypothetical protein